MDLYWSATIDRIRQLFERHGASGYEGARRESVSALEHALQCAQLAEWADAPSTLVAAALLHDVGHFIAADAIALNDRVDDRHEVLAIDLLAEGFGAAVSEPVRLHVEAKRYLVWADEGYALTLSPASQHSLALQGGAMNDSEAEAFEALPYAREAVQLRRWDDLAKHPGKRTPSLDYYLALLLDLEQAPFACSRTGIGALDAV